MNLQEAKSIVADFFKVLEQVNPIENESEVGYYEYLLPHSKFSIKQAILTAYDNPQKTQRENDAYGMLYMRLGSFGIFKNGEELMEEAKKWATEWFRLTQ